MLHESSGAARYALLSFCSSGKVICPLTTQSGRTSTEASRVRMGFWSFHRFMPYEACWFLRHLLTCGTAAHRIAEKGWRQSKETIGAGKGGR